MDTPSLLTPKQVANYCGVSLSLVYALLQAGKLPALRIRCRGRGKYLILREDVDGFLASCKLSELPAPDDGPFTFLR